METRINYAAVGLFILTLALLWVAASVWLLFGNPSTSYNQFYTYMTESVSGLYEDSAVRYHGVEVGTVSAIELVNSERVRLTLDIVTGAPIKTNTKATLHSQGLTGLYYVELVGGTREAPLLIKASEARIPVIESVPSLFMRLDTSVTRVLDQLTSISQRLSHLLSEENLASIETTLDNIAALTATLAERKKAVADILDNLRTLTGELAARTDTIGKAIENFAETAKNAAAFSRGLPEIREQVESLVTHLAQVGRKLDRLVTAAAPGIKHFTGATLNNVNQAVVALEQTLNDFNRLIDRLQANPNLLIVGGPKRAPGPGEE